MIIVIMTGTKLYGIMYPMKVFGNKFKIKKAFINVSLTFILCTFINFHFLFSHSIIVENLNDDSLENQTINEKNRTIKTHKICANVMWFDFYDIFWPYIDAFAYSFLPFISLTILNIIIIHNIRKSKKQNLELRQHDSLSRFSIRYSRNLTSRNVSLKLLNIQNENLPQRRMAIVEEHKEHSLGVFSTVLKVNKTKGNRLTLLIILLNISFFLLTMPVVILQLLIQSEINKKVSLNDCNKNAEWSTRRNNKYDALLKSIFEILQYLNHSLNFLFYCLSGKTFRDETKKFFLNNFNCLCLLKNRSRNNHFE